MYIKPKFREKLEMIATFILVVLAMLIPCAGDL